ncbi:MAG: phage tail protein [Enhygromyxa sp.]
MRAPAHRPFVLIQTLDQWRRCAHEQTSLDPLDGAVELARLPGRGGAGGEVKGAAGEVEEELPSLAGLVFDRHCRLYRALPDEGQIHMHRWASARLDPLEVPDDREGRALFASVDSAPLGEFVSTEQAVGPLRGPSGLAIDGQQRLYAWEAQSGGLLIWDLEQRRIVQRTVLGYDGPVDLAWIGDRLLGVGPQLPGMLEWQLDGKARLRPYPSELSGVPARVAGDSRGRVYLLLDAGTAAARVVALAGNIKPLSVAGASDLLFLAAREQAGGQWVERLVVARGPDQPLRSFVIGAQNVSEGDPLAARGYDGRGIARTPDDRIVYFGARGLRHAVAAAVRHAERGRVLGFRLDAGEFQARWGRVFVDACVPRGTELRVATYVSDDPPNQELEDLPWVRTPPVNATTLELNDPLQPPMPPKSRVPATIGGRLVLRSEGRELPWTIRDDRDRKRFGTWEAVVDPSADAGQEQRLGRYLWVFLELRGNGRRTPRVRSLRIERAGHPLLARLPKVFSRDPAAAEFLWRFLAPFDGALADVELRTVLRHALLHPQSSPEPFLPWLASLLGLVLDQRWPVAARREAIAEAAWLFRFRGTLPGLKRMLELYLGDGRVEIIEHFRVRGLGGAVVSGEGPAESSAIVGAGFRVGGAIGTDELVDLGTEQSLSELGADGFVTHAHRFTVAVLASLTGEQREVVEHILDEHRPAHTLYELCSVDAGLRVGVGLHVGLGSVVGPSSGWTSLQLGASTLGGDALVGQARAGTRLGSARLGEDSQAG